MFSLNSKLSVKKSSLFNSTLYEIENFYDDPDLVENYIQMQNPPLWKIEQGQWGNGVYFDDRRHTEVFKDLGPVYSFLSDLTGHKPAELAPKLLTNQFRMLSENHNNYKECYWFPHKDSGYTAIVYLNRETAPGTNLYHPRSVLDKDKFEHQDPWKPRTNYDLVYTSEARFNSAFVFDGLFFPHGMAIEDSRFFTETRLNQAFFMLKKICLSFEEGKLNLFC